MNDQTIDTPASSDTATSSQQQPITAIPSALLLNEELGNHLPNSQQIYTRLREGTHLSADNPTLFPLFRELEKHRNSYTSLFHVLGYELTYHPDGFFYFIYPDSTTPQSLTMSRRASLLIYTLIDFLQDNNYDPATTITSESIELRLIDDTRRHYADLYEQADLASLDAVINLLEWMSRRGFCQQTSEEHIRFLKPVSRFLEAAEQVARMADADPKAAEAITSTDPEEQP